LQRFVPNPLFNKTVRPVAKGAKRNFECRLMREASAAAAGRCVQPREESENSAGLSAFVAVIKMIGARVIKIDGFLDDDQAERAGADVEFLFGSSFIGRV